MRLLGFAALGFTGYRRGTRSGHRGVARWE
jgi:hypothetical protein